MKLLSNRLSRQKTPAKSLLIPQPLPQGGRGGSFAAAFADWRALEARLGPALAYRPAKKLPDLAKGAGESARQQAAWAVGSTLFWRGRFSDARKWLPPSAEGLTCLGWTLALQGEREAALALPHSALPNNALLHFFLDDPEACLSSIGTPANPVDAAQADLLRYWAYTRFGEQPDEAVAQAALATLRRLAPCEEARGTAIHAEAAFSRQPLYALPHLDHALDLFARFGLHHLEARLLNLKAQALDAAGLLGDASRFHQAAAEARRHQAL